MTLIGFSIVEVHTDDWDQLSRSCVGQHFFHWKDSSSWRHCALSSPLHCPCFETKLHAYITILTMILLFIHSKNYFKIWTPVQPACWNLSEFQLKVSSHFVPKWLLTPSQYFYKFSATRPTVLSHNPRKTCSSTVHWGHASFYQSPVQTAVSQLISCPHGAVTHDTSCRLFNIFIALVASVTLDFNYFSKKYFLGVNLLLVIALVLYHVTYYIVLVIGEGSLLWHLSHPHSAGISRLTRVFISFFFGLFLFFLMN